MTLLTNLVALSAGIWRAILFLPEGELPFNFMLVQEQDRIRIELINGEEKIIADEINIVHDSIFIRLPVFDSEIRAKINENELEGEWINYSRKSNQRIRFSAKSGISDRFFHTGNSLPTAIEGRWEAWFSPGTDDSSLAIGVFHQQGKKATGTFLTASGDYRFLEGKAENDSLYLSCFDGSHAFLFKAKVNGSKMQGVFLSGNHWKEPWIAERNESIELPDPDSLTFLKPGFDRFDFAFPDMDSNIIKLSDHEFRDKVKVIQIFGSWCPNCLDESKFLADFYGKHSKKGIEIFGIAFEKTDDFQKAVYNVKRLKERVGINYKLLIAGNRERINELLPMVGKIIAYPTTIYIDRKDRVRKIYTGFYGPATGKYYEKYKDDFERFIFSLLTE